MRKFLLIFAFLFPAGFVFALDLETLTNNVSVRQEVVFQATGRYEYIAPVCDPGGCYISNHVEKWCGQTNPCGVEYQVIYTKTDGSTRAVSTNVADENFNWDWTPPISAVVNTSTL